MEAARRRRLRLVFYKYCAVCAPLMIIMRAPHRAAIGARGLPASARCHQCVAADRRSEASSFILIYLARLRSARLRGITSAGVPSCACGRRRVRDALYSYDDVDDINSAPAGSLAEPP